jgi:hypothetical protein
MPIYSETLNDYQILRMIGRKHKRILVIGCGACMNESLAFKYNIPLYVDNLETPSATIIELKRIKKMLIDNGYQVEIKYYNSINGFYCMTNVSVTEYPLDRSCSPDVILVLSCNSGCEGLRDKLPTAKIIRITELIGGVTYGYKDVDCQRIIVANESMVIPMVERRNERYAKVQ